MNCFKCGAENGEENSACWQCDFVFDGSEQVLGVYPITYDEKGMALTIQGVMMLTTERILFRLISKEEMKEEKKKIKGFFVDKYEAVIDKILNLQRFENMPPDDFLKEKGQVLAFSQKEILSAVYKVAFAASVGGTHRTAKTGWRPAWLILETEDFYHRILVKVPGNDLEQEYNFIQLLERYFASKIEITTGNLSQQQGPK